jgi:hypothetical protein
MDGRINKSKKAFCQASQVYCQFISVKKTDESFLNFRHEKLSEQVFRSEKQRAAEIRSFFSLSRARAAAGRGKKVPENNCEKSSSRRRHWRQSEGGGPRGRVGSACKKIIFFRWGRVAHPSLADTVTASTHTHKEEKEKERKREREKERKKERKRERNIGKNE